MSAYPFPSEFKRPEDKEKPEYGLQYILAAFHSTDRFGTGIFGDNTEIQSLIELAQGRQSTEDIAKLFGKFRGTTSDYDDGPESLVYIDPQVLNLAPKYINRAVAKMQARAFDISLEAIDLPSIDAKEDYAASIQAFYRLKEWVQQMGIPLQAAFEGLDVDSLPEFPDELLYDISTNPKLKTEIAGEQIIRMIHSMNRFAHKMRQVDWNMVVTGWGHLDCFADSNGIPRVKVIPHEFWGGSYVDDDDFEDQEYAFYIEPITVNQFIREASPYYKREDLEFLANKYSIQNSLFHEGIHQLDNLDNLSYMLAVRFYFLSEDSRTFVKRNNQYGTPILMEKDFNYQPPADVIHRYDPESGDSRIIKNTYTSVYGGTWILNSNIVYNYGRKNIPRTNLVNATLPIKTYAVNYKKGRAVSFAAQMVEPLHMINVAWNKIKETLAKGWIGIQNIDLTAIEAAALGKGGQVWTPREVIEYLNMTNRAVGRRNAGNQWGQSNGDIVTVTPAGVQLADYFSTITLAIQMLEQMTATSVVESTNVPDRLPAKAVNASMLASDVDMEYLHHAHQYLFERATHMQLLLAQEALKNPDTYRYFLPAIGKANIDALRKLPYCEMGIRLMRQPGPEEWLEFYQDVRIALDAGAKGLPGGIRLSDAMFLREIDNLKQARRVLVLREAQFRRELMEQKQLDNQMAMEANQAAAEAKFRYDSELKKVQGLIDENITRLKGQIELMKQEQQISLNRQSQLIAEEMKRHIKDIEGKYSVLKEGLRSQSEDYKSDLSYEAKVYAADRAAQTAEKIAEKKAVEARKKEKKKPVKSK